MEILVKAAQLILSLSIIVTLHEMGHFLPARWFGIRVEKFFLFFDVKFSLWEKKIGDTVYGIGWLPLGGYVKIAGMVDESMDKEQMALPPKPDEFRSKPVWQRLIVMVGGVVVNILLGFLIYAMVLFTWGEQYISMEDVKYGVHPSETMKAQGVQEGDMVLSLDGETFKQLNGISKQLLLSGGTTLRVNRNGQELDIPLAADISDLILDAGEREPLAIRAPFFVDSLVPAGGAITAGLQKNDKVLAVNDQETAFFGDFVRMLQTQKDTMIRVTVERNSELVKIDMKVSEEGTVGVSNRDADAYFNVTRIEYGFMESFPAGINKGTRTLVDYAKSLKLLFKPAGIKQIGGFGTIGSLFSGTWNWRVFWSMTAFISIILGLMNILPIPALDGGHVVFLLWEMITGKAAPQRVLEVAQLVGFFLIIGLVLYANGNDVIKAWFN